MANKDEAILAGKGATKYGLMVCSPMGRLDLRRLNKKQLLNPLPGQELFLGLIYFFWSQRTYILASATLAGGRSLPKR